MNKKQYVSQLDCTRLIDFFDRSVSKGGFKLWTDPQKSDTRVFHAEKKIPEFAPLHEKLVLAYSENVGVSPDYSFLLVNRVVPQTNGLGSGGGWHRDSWFNQKKVFVFLTDVGLKNGPLEYVPGSNSLGAKSIDFLRNKRSVRVSADKIVNTPKSVLANAGEGFILDTTVVHRGRPIEEGVRYAATLYAFNLNSSRLTRCKEKFSSL